jgi:hypothetical protein
MDFTLTLREIAARQMGGKKYVNILLDSAVVEVMHRNGRINYIY